MSCEVDVAVPVPEINGAFASKAEALTPEEWMIVRLYRGFGESDKAWMLRIFFALAARKVPD